MHLHSSSLRTFECSNCCLTKNVVYEIKCSTCGAAYIGETSRTIGTRIKEHLTMEKQTVFKHLLLHKKQKENKIIWKILHSNVRNDKETKVHRSF